MTLTTQQLADRLCVSQRTINRWAHEPDFPAVKRGRLDWSEFVAWLARHEFPRVSLSLLNGIARRRIAELRSAA